MKVPAVIHLIFLSKHEKYPDVFEVCIERIKSLHPFWEIKIYDEEDAINIIAENLPDLLPLYRNYSHLVQKADLLRVILVYLFGGFYLDMDMYCLKPLDELRRFNVVLGEEKTLSEVERIQLGLAERVRIANYMFGSIAGHPFWLFFLQAALGLSFKKVITENDILETTGPGLLSNVFGRLKSTYADIVLLENQDRDCLVESSHEISCHFGNYAAHLHQGTWRWANGTQKKEKAVVPIEENDFTRAHLTLETKIAASCKYYYNINVSLSSDQDPAYNLLFNSVKGLNRRVERPNNNIFLLCGNPIKLNDPISPSNLNVLYTCFDTSMKSPDCIAQINRLFRMCIVPTMQDKKAFIDAGLSVPVCIVHPGFNRYIRNFKADEDSPYFNVGFLYNDSTSKYYELLINVCKQLQEKHIKVIRLKVYDNTLTLEKKHTLSSTIETRVDIHTNFNDWYKDIHCSIHLSPAISFTSMPYESLYLGIPTIINHGINMGELMEAAYFDLININAEDAADTLKNAILGVYNNYAHKQQVAAEGAAWVADKWLIQDAQQKIVSIFDDLIH